MRRKARETFEGLDKFGHDASDIRPLTPAMRRQWEMAKRAGKKTAPGRPRKDPRLKSKIVPISMDPQLLAEIDRYAKSAGLSRSRLVAEGLRLRLKGSFRV